MGVRFNLCKLSGKYLHTVIRHRYRSILVTSLRQGHNISVTPQDVLIDQDVQIKLSGFQPKQKVTLFASIHENETKFAANGHYVSDDNGVVDVTSMPSVGGTYTGVEPMGVFWSMKAHPRLGEHTCVQTDIETPSTVSVSVVPGHHSLKDLHADDVSLKPLASTTLQRHWMSNDVKRVSVSDGNIRGTLFLPAGEGPHPAVLDISDCTGDLVESRAALLASKGYATLALAYWGHKGLFDIATKPDFDYFMEATDWLSSQPNVISDGIGVVGFSKGGHVSLLLGQHNPKVKAVVNISGAPFCVMEDLAWKQGSFMKGIPIDFTRLKEISNFCFTVREYEADWRNHLIEAWTGNAKCLYINGADDQCLNPLYARYWYELIPEDKKANFQMITYPETGHMIDTPYTHMYQLAYDKHLNFSVFMGGIMKPQADAKKDAWNKILKFFEENLKIS